MLDKQTTKAHSAGYVLPARLREATSARSLSDHDLALEAAHCGRLWNEIRAVLEEGGGASGSPGEWLWERMSEVEAEQQRRKSP